MRSWLSVCLDVSHLFFKLYYRVLVNGSDGIGTGWSSNVPNYDPRQIIANIRNLIAGEEQTKMDPFFDGYFGELVAESGKREGSYQVLGKIERLDDTRLFISELPIKKWTQDYKMFLESMMNGDAAKKIEAEIKDFRENHTDTTVAFTVVAAKEIIDKFEKDPKGLMGKFKLTGSLSTSNMHLFDAEGRIAKYNTPEDMLLEFFTLRLDFYDKRKELLLNKMRREQSILTNKARFIEEVCAGELVVSNRKRSEILAELQERGYDLREKEDEKKETEEDAEEEEEEMSDAELARGYEYLLGMKIWSLTFEKAEELRRQLAEKMMEVQALEETTPSQLWLNDLDDIEEALDDRAGEMAAAAREEDKAQKKAKKIQASKTKKAGGRKKKNDWDSDMEDDDSDEENIKPRAPAVRKPAVVKSAVLKAPAMRKPAVKAVAAPPKAIAAPPKRALEKTKSVLEQAKEESDSDSDMEIGLSLAERMKSKLMVSPPAKRTNIKAKSSFEESDDDEFALDMAEFEPASVTPAKKKAAVKKAPVKKVAAAPAAAKKPAARKPAAKKPVAKKKIVEVFSDEEDDFLEDSESEEEQAAAPKRTAAGRARSKVTYTLDFSDDDESDYE